MVNLKDWYESKSTSTKILFITSIVIGTLLIIGGIVVLGLWLGGILFKTKDTTPAIPPCAPGNKEFTIKQTIENPQDVSPQFGITADGTYLVTGLANDYTDNGFIIAYKLVSGKYEYIGQSETLPSERRIYAFSKISPQGTFVATLLQSTTGLREQLYVTKRNGDNLFTNPVVFPSLTADPDPTAAFHIADVTFDGEDQMVIGFRHETTSVGSMFVYRYNESTNIWENKQNIVNPNPNELDSWGLSVSIVNDIMMCGSVPGKVYEFKKTADKVWELRTDQTITVSDASSLTCVHVTLSQDQLKLFIADYSYDSNKGRVLYYKRNDTLSKWSLVKTISDPDVNYFGLNTFLFENSRLIIMNFILSDDTSQVFYQFQVYNFDSSSDTFTKIQTISDEQYDVTKLVVQTIAFTRQGSALYMLRNKYGSSSGSKIFIYSVDC
jgi:hypothetical protein